MATVEYLSEQEVYQADPSWHSENPVGHCDTCAGWYVWTEYEDLPRGPYKSKDEAEKVAAVWTQAEYERRKARED